MVSLGNIVCSLLICVSFYNEVKASISWRILRLCAPIAIVNTMGVISLYYCMYHLSPMFYGLLSRFYIIFSLILAVVFLKESFSRKQIYFILLSIIGCIFFMARDKIEHIEIMPILGCLLSCFCFALSYMMTKMQSVRLNPKIIFFYNNLIGLLPIGIYLMCIDNTLVFPQLVDCIFIFGSAISFFMSMIYFFKGLESIPFGRANVLRSLSPIVLASISMPFFPEKFSLLNIAGAILILISLTCLGVQNGRKRTV